MIKHSAYATISLAKTYSSQGHIEQALEIYRHLLQNSPDDQELQKAISDLENAEALNTAKPFPEQKDLTRLLETWIELTLQYKKIMTLKRLKRNHQ
jgi:tetratricopeptide (TPR) repeat protein